MSSLGRLGICLLNISEARNYEVIERVAKAATTRASGEGPQHLSSVLNIFQDIDYNRSVLTIAAPISHLKSAVCGACREAYRLIDLSSQEGVHPRLGSVDLIPVYPLSATVSLQECGTIARSIAEYLSDNIQGTSFFLFGAADLPQCRSLVPRRKAVGWFRGKSGIDWSKFTHDFGARPSSRYGLTGVGASHYVTNCNVTIDTQDLEAGREIATAIRATSAGGLPGVQAMAFPHEGRVEIACNVDSIDQKSTNLASSGGNDAADQGGRGEKIAQEDTPIVLDYTPPDVIEQRVRELAVEKQIELVGTALVGFRPEQAWKVAMEALKTGQDQFWKTRNILRM
ncbi:uncharacterized protein [Diadema antillarum]|uniref:uncharacterized protein n=1 Tax=Diadema antillarum TaxID=105358 RepID=UPI003A846810